MEKGCFVGFVVMPKIFYLGVLFFLYTYRKIEKCFMHALIPPKNTH